MRQVIGVISAATVGLAPRVTDYPVNDVYVNGSFASATCL